MHIYKGSKFSSGAAEVGVGEQICRGVLDLGLSMIMT